MDILTAVRQNYLFKNKTTTMFNSAQLIDDLKKLEANNGIEQSILVTLKEGHIEIIAGNATHPIMALVNANTKQILEQFGKLTESQRFI